MSYFNAGDKVVCVDDSGARTALVVGQEYTIIEADGPSLCLVASSDGVVSGGWLFHRFKPVPKKEAPVPKPAPFSDLRKTLDGAFEQAASGKGAERHGNGKPWREQPIFKIAEKHGTGFLSGQAAKKLEESLGLPTKEAKIRELRGVINYVAALIQMIEEEPDDPLPAAH